MQGTIYGVGVGPGDPELLTLEAVRILKSCDLIAVPDSGSGEQLALNIAAQFIEGKPVLHCSMPMTRDEAALAKAHEATAAMLCEQLANGMNIAFLTLGDPSVYSTYMYVHRLVQKMGFPAKMVAGIPSFCAAAAELNTSLCEGGQALHIIPASYVDTGEALSLAGTKVLMKSGKSLQEILDNLADNGLGKNVSMVQRCRMPGQKIAQSLEKWDGKADYFTLVIVKEDMQ